MPKPPLCEGCPQQHVGGTFVPPDHINGSTRLVVWGEAPGATEAQLKRGLVGPSGRELRSAVRGNGIRTWSAWPNDPPIPWMEEELACSNAVLCRPPGNRFPGPLLARECLRRHDHGLPRKAPFLLLGANAIEAMTGYRLNPLKIRGSLLPLLGSQKFAVASFHPAYLVRGMDSGTKGKSQDHLRPLLRLDVHRALTMQTPEVPKIRFCRTPMMVLDEWKAKPANDDLLSIDIEGKDGQPNILGLSWMSGAEHITRVMYWDSTCPRLMQALFETAMPVYHNAAYDVPEMEEAGCKPPPRWIDTINLAALYDPDLPMNLQLQVLAHVSGSVGWKDLVDHQKGPNYEEGKIRTCRSLWREVLHRIGRKAPATGEEFFLFYNGLDTAWTLLLALSLRESLKSQGRLLYYNSLMGPLQGHLLEMGQRGLPVDPARMAVHRTGCERLIRIASGIMRSAGAEVLDQIYQEKLLAVQHLEGLRELERQDSAKRVKFSQAAELTSARNKLKVAERNLEAGFNYDSSQQAAKLFYDYYGLPVVKAKESGNPTTNDDAIDSLILRLTREDDEGKPCPTIWPKRERGGKKAIPEVVRVLRAKRAAKKWATWKRNFLREM